MVFLSVRFVIFVPKTDGFWSKWAKKGSIFDFSSKNPGVFMCIPGIKLPKYTYALTHFINTIAPPSQKLQLNIKAIPF